jgi:hypothetical protein
VWIVDYQDLRGLRLLQAISGVECAATFNGYEHGMRLLRIGMIYIEVIPLKHPY